MIDEYMETLYQRKHEILRYTEMQISDFSEQRISNEEAQKLNAKVVAFSLSSTNDITTIKEILKIEIVTNDKIVICEIRMNNFVVNFDLIEKIKLDPTQETLESFARTIFRPVERNTIMSVFDKYYRIPDCISIESAYKMFTEQTVAQLFFHNFEIDEDGNQKLSTSDMHIGDFLCYSIDYISRNFLNIVEDFSLTKKEILDLHEIIIKIANLLNPESKNEESEECQYRIFIHMQTCKLKIATLFESLKSLTKKYLKIVKEIEILSREVERNFPDFPIESSIFNYQTYIHQLRLFLDFENSVKIDPNFFQSLNKTKYHLKKETLFKKFSAIIDNSPVYPILKTIVESSEVQSELREKIVTEYTNCLNKSSIIFQSVGHVVFSERISHILFGNNQWFFEDKHCNQEYFLIVDKTLKDQIHISSDSEYSENPWRFVNENCITLLWNERCPLTDSELAVAIYMLTEMLLKQNAEMNLEQNTLELYNIEFTHEDIEKFGDTKSSFNQMIYLLELKYREDAKVLKNKEREELRKIVFINNVILFRVKLVFLLLEVQKICCNCRPDLANIIMNYTSSNASPDNSLKNISNVEIISNQVCRLKHIYKCRTFFIKNREYLNERNISELKVIISLIIQPLYEQVINYMIENNIHINLDSVDNFKLEACEIISRFRKEMLKTHESSEVNADDSKSNILKTTCDAQEKVPETHKKSENKKTFKTFFIIAFTIIGFISTVIWIYLTNTNLFHATLFQWSPTIIGLAFSIIFFIIKIIQTYNIHNRIYDRVPELVT